MQELSLSLLNSVEAQMLASIRSNAPNSSRRMGAGSDAAKYHLHAGGQRVRTKIALHAGLAAGLNIADVVTIAAAVELLHNASLVHDDIQDRDELRRGQQAVWFRFGINTAICAGDLLLSAAYATLCKLEDLRVLPQIILLVHERVSKAIDGQCADLNVSSETSADGEVAADQYQKIAIAKSGALLSLPLELILLASGQQEYSSDARRAAEAFSVAYQIVDDLQDVQSDLRTGTAKCTYNVVSLFRTSCNLYESIEKAKSFGLEKIETTIRLSKRLPSNMGARLVDYALQLRYVLNEYQPEAKIVGVE